MMFIYTSKRSGHKSQIPIKTKRRNRFWVYAIDCLLTVFLYENVS